MKIGYARVSTLDQNPQMQVDSLIAAGVDPDYIFTEHKSGKNRNRPALKDCLRMLRGGDTLVVWKLDRLGRSLIDLIQILDELKTRGVGFTSLNDSIDTNTAAGQMLFQIMGAFAEFERNTIAERTRAGMEAARRAGKAIGGRQPKLKPAQTRMLLQAKASGNFTDKQIAEQFGISMSTFYRITRQAEDSKAAKTLDRMAA